MPYICVRRTDMGDALAQGTLYVGDLLPVAGKPMPKLGADADNVDRSTAESPYIPVATAAGSTVATEDPGDGSTVTSAEYTGLSAFLLDNCVNDTTDGALSAANALTISTALVDEMRTNGGAMTSGDIETIIQLTDVQVTFARSEAQNPGFVEGVVRCLAGQTYTVASGGQIAAVGGAATAAVGAFTAASQRAAANVSSSMALTESLANGQLAAFTAASFSYSGTDAAAFVVYDDDGSVL